MRYDNIIPFTYQRFEIKKNTIDIRTLCEQNNHEYDIVTVGFNTFCEMGHICLLSTALYNPEPNGTCTRTN